ncbi:restriction endonuclease subunit S [bacterium]|nr:restriction endonuclease subunit S [bacterium]
MGTAPPGSSYNDEGVGLPLVAGAGDYGDLHPEPDRWTTEASRVTQPGEIIICVRATVGDLNLADRRLCLGRGVGGVRPKSEFLSDRFAWNVLKAKKSVLEDLATGAVFPAIRRAHLEDLELPLPPLDEQRRIADTLDTADGIRRRHLQARDEAKALLSALSAREFTRLEEDASVPKVRLGDVAEIVSGSTPKTTVAEYWGGGIPWITPKDLSTQQSPSIASGAKSISQAGLKSCSTRLIPEGSVLFSSRAPIGLVAVARNALCTNQGFKSLVPRGDAHSGFLYHTLRHDRPKLEALGSGATFKELSKARFSDFLIPLPPPRRTTPHRRHARRG